MIDKESFDKIWYSHKPSQGKYEYFLFLDFVHSYFMRAGVDKPVVLEIGVRSRRQRFFWEELINARYFGLDIKEKVGDEFLLGDSSKPETLELVKNYMKKMGYEHIDLLFIDGDHWYDAAKVDWELYSPLTKHLVAIHDIYWILDNWDARSGKTGERGLGDRESVSKLWYELKDKGVSVVEFGAPYLIDVYDTANSSSEKYLGDAGIGVIIKSRPEPELRWKYEKNTFEKDWGVGGRAYPRLVKL